MTTVSSNMLITNETLSQISRELLGTENILFEFTHILVGDGEVPLENSSGPVLNHIYEFPIVELARNRNNILLTATIDENAFLTIRELALYCNYSDGTKHIFSKLTGLNVSKKADLIYKLIIHVNLNINVVNTVAFPQIIVKDPEYINTSEFENIKKIYTYTVENLERMIKTNALGIGAYINGLSQDINGTPFIPVRPYGLDSTEYGKMSELKPVGVGYNAPQVFYKYYDRLGEWKESYFSLFNYSNIKAKFPKEAEYYTEFDSSLVEGFGSAIIDNDGRATIPTTEITGRIQATNFAPINFNRWDYGVSFRTPKNISNTLSVLNFCNKTHYQPMVLDINEGKCRLRLGSKSVLTLTDTTGTIDVPITCHNGTNSPADYIEWEPSIQYIPNLHVDVVGNPMIASTDIFNFSTTDYVTTNRLSFSGNNWALLLSFNSGSVPPPEGQDPTGDTASGTVLSYGEPTSTGLKGVTISISSETLTVSLSFDGSTVGGTLTTTGIEDDSQYNLVLLFNGTTYTLQLNGEIVDTLSTSSQVWSSSNVEAYLGVNKVNNAIANSFTGSINLQSCSLIQAGITTWTGACFMTQIYTTEVSPNSNSIFYDQEKYPMNSLAFDSFYESNLLEEDLFEVKPEAKYVVLVKFDGSYYKVEYSEDNENFIQALNYPMGNMINTVSNLIMGATYSAYDNEYSGQFSGTLYLDKFYINFSDIDFEGVERDHKEYKFVKEIEIKSDVTLEDFYCIPEYKYNYFKVNNLCEEKENYALTVLNGNITGFKDNINFANDKGFCLILKTHIKDAMKDKTIIAKGNLETGEFYFTFEFKGKEENNGVAQIVFTYFLGDQSVSVAKNISDNEVVSYISQPVTFFITFDGASSPSIKIYRNNALIAVRTLPNNSSLDPNNYSLTNKIYENEEPSDERILNDIISIAGTLSTFDIYYINNLLDTNF